MTGFSLSLPTLFQEEKNLFLFSKPELIKCMADVNSSPWIDIPPPRPPQPGVAGMRHEPWAMITLGSVQPLSLSQQGFWWGLRKQETKWQHDRLGTGLGGGHSSITEIILSWILFYSVLNWPAKTKVWGFVLGKPRCTEWELRSWKAWVDLSFSLSFFLTRIPFELFDWLQSPGDSSQEPKAKIKGVALRACLWWVVL